MNKKKLVKKIVVIGEELLKNSSQVFFKGITKDGKAVRAYLPKEWEEAKNEMTRAFISAKKYSDKLDKETAKNDPQVKKLNEKYYALSTTHGEYAKPIMDFIENLKTQTLKEISLKQKASLNEQRKHNK